MSIRTILCPFTGATDTPSIRMALAVARDLDAHVVGMYVEAPLRHVPGGLRMPAMGGLGADAYGAMPRPVSAPGPWANAERSGDEAAAAAKGRFALLCRDHEVAFLGADRLTPQAEHTLPSASFERRTGDLAAVIGHHAYAYDMVVTEGSSIAKESKPARAAIDTALIQAGRPVLLSPATPPDHLDGHIMVAWKDSPQCWHALSQALPFMTRAKEVTLLHAGKSHDQRLSAQEAADYLAWHGVRAEVTQHEPGPAGIADYLMSQCSERHVDLMVMGAYSHSPLRERLLGGVTNSVVSHVAATPVLMTH